MQLRECVQPHAFKLSLLGWTMLMRMHMCDHSCRASSDSGGKFDLHAEAIDIVPEGRARVGLPGACSCQVEGCLAWKQETTGGQPPAGSKQLPSSRSHGICSIESKPSFILMLSARCTVMQTGTLARSAVQAGTHE